MPPIREDRITYFPDDTRAGFFITVDKPAIFEEIIRNLTGYRQIFPLRGGFSGDWPGFKKTKGKTDMQGYQVGGMETRYRVSILLLRVR
jgi:hypothetical protein